MQQEIRLDLFLYNQLDETVLEKEQLQSGYDLVRVDTINAIQSYDQSSKHLGRRQIKTDKLNF